MYELIVISNGLDVLVAPAFMRPDPPDLRQRLDERGMLAAVAEVLPHVHPLGRHAMTPPCAAAS